MAYTAYNTRSVCAFFIFMLRQDDSYGFKKTTFTLIRSENFILDSMKEDAHQKLS